MKTFFLGSFVAAVALAQGPLDPALLLKPLGDSWPTYSGDYSGKRYSSLAQINQSNVKNLTLGWVTRVRQAATGGGRGAAPVTRRWSRDDGIRRRRRNQHPRVDSGSKRHFIFLDAR